MAGLIGRDPAGAVPAGANPSAAPRTAMEWEWARRRVEKKHKLRADVAAYVVINAFLIGAWAATGFGYFWPGWVLAGWGVLLLLDAWNLYYRRPLTAEDIDRELRGGGH
jgi:fatty acid desaturase